MQTCSAYGALTVRILLDTIEHCMKEFDFPDPYLHVGIFTIFFFKINISKRNVCVTSYCFVCSKKKRRTKKH